jgi:hypothetical protein
VQTYKKVLFLLLFACITGINNSCHRKVLPTNYPMKPGFFPITIPFKEYRLKRDHNFKDPFLTRADRKNVSRYEKNKQLELKKQEQGRKEHLARQNPKVRERMKKSFEESEKSRGRKSFWERLMFWKKEKTGGKKTISKTPI